MTTGRSTFPAPTTLKTCFGDLAQSENYVPLTSDAIRMSYLGLQRNLAGPVLANSEDKKPDDENLLLNHPAGQPLF
jgi:hypothetical protein